MPRKYFLPATLSILAIGIIFSLILLPRSDPAVVRIVTPPSIIASLPHWVAEDRDMYKDYGLSVEIVEYNVSRQMIDSFQAGDADLLPAVSLVDVVKSAQKLASNNIVIFSHSRMQRLPAFESLLVPTSSPVKTLSDLEGKTIAVYPGETSEAVVKSYLTKHNVNASSIRFVRLPPPAHLTALSTGDADASHSYDPFKAQLMVNGYARPISDSVYASLNEPSAIGVSVISRRLLEDQPKVAAKILQVWDHAIEFIETKPEHARQILSQKLKLDPRTAEQAVWVNATSTDQTSSTTVFETIKSLTEAGLLTPTPEVFESIVLTETDFQ